MRLMNICEKSKQALWTWGHQIWKNHFVENQSGFFKTNSVTKSKIYVVHFNK